MIGAVNSNRDRSRKKLLSFSSTKQASVLACKAIDVFVVLSQASVLA